MTMLNHVARAALIGAMIGAAPLAANAEAVRAPAQAAASVPAAYDAAIGAAKAAIMSDPAAALASSREALTLARASAPSDGQAVQVATALWLEGEALIRLNRPQEAAPAIEQALPIAAAKAPNTTLHGRITLASGSVFASLGEAKPALERFQSAYDIFARANDARGQALAMQNIGSLYQDAGDYPKVLDCYAKAAALYPADLALQVAAYNNMGNALKAMGRYGEAEAQFQLASGLSQEMGSATLQTRILTNLASTDVLAGRLQDADNEIIEALALSDRDEGAREWRPFIWGVAAQAALHRGDLKSASMLIGRTFEGVDIGKTDAVFRDFHLTASHVYAELGDSRRAALHQAAFERLSAPARLLIAR